MKTTTAISRATKKEVSALIAKCTPSRLLRTDYKINVTKPFSSGDFSGMADSAL